MSSDENWFPFRPLDTEETEKIQTLYETTTVAQTGDTAGLFALNAASMIQGDEVKSLLSEFGAISLDTLDIDPHEGWKIFGRGALLYSGVLAEVTPLQEIPFEQEVLDSISSFEEHDFLIEVIGRLEGEATTFCDLMEPLSLAIGIFEPKEKELAMIGAGVVHFVTTESMDVQATRQIAKFEVDHPELASLESTFQSITSNLPN